MYKLTSIAIATAALMVGTPALAQSATVTVDGPNRDATIDYERTRTENGVVRTRNLTSGDYSSSKTYQRSYDPQTRSWSSTTDWSNSNGKSASGATTVTKTGKKRWQRSSDYVGPNGGTRSVDQTVKRTGNSGYWSKKTVTSPTGDSRTVKKRVTRKR